MKLIKLKTERDVIYIDTLAVVFSQNNQTMTIMTNGHKFNASLAEVITGNSTLERLVIILKKKFTWGSGDINFAIAKYTCLLSWYWIS